jgi:hypothetical protein
LDSGEAAPFERKPALLGLSRPFWLELLTLPLPFPFRIGEDSDEREACETRAGLPEERRW